MINPQQHVINAILASLPDYSVWSNRVPRGVTTPSEYILVTDISINEYANCKHGNEWLVGFNLDIVSVYSLGYDTQDIVNNIVQDVIPALKNLTSPVIEIKNVDLEGSRSMTYDTSTQSITRQILTYTVWCEYQD